MIAGCISIGLGLGALVLPAQAAGSCESSANFGSIYVQSDSDNAVKALPAEALLGKRGKPVGKLDKRVMLGNLPAIAQQGTASDPGSPGTCEAQSFGYGLGSYTAARTASGGVRWNAAIPQNSTSAAWLYELIQKNAHRACPNGSRGLDYLEQLASVGAASRSQVPYQPRCNYLDGVSTDARPNMGRFRIGSYAVIPVTGNAGAVAAIKSQLQTGQAVAFTGRVLCGYALAPSFKFGVIYDTATVPGSGHGQMIVGYDDRVGKSGQRGAFLVQNSFGVGWPPRSAGSAAPPGQAYWSYNSFATTQSMAAVAYPVSTDLGKLRLRGSVVNATAATVVHAYQWTSRTDDKSVYLIIRLAFAGPVKLNEVWLSEPGSKPLLVKAAYGQHIGTGYVYLKRGDGKSFVSGRYNLTLKTGDTASTAVTYSGKVKVKKLKKRGALVPATMRGTPVTGPTGAAVTGN
ncbi:MAG: hypothetical protein U1E16_08545 [Hyphomicrobiales bacterium]